jgi:hypothetical protein
MLLCDEMRLQTTLFAGARGESEAIDVNAQVRAFSDAVACPDRSATQGLRCSPALEHKNSVPSLSRCSNSDAARFTRGLVPMWAGLALVDECSTEVARDSVKVNEGSARVERHGTSRRPRLGLGRAMWWGPSTETLDGSTDTSKARDGACADRRRRLGEGQRRLGASRPRRSVSSMETDDGSTEIPRDGPFLG